MTEALKRRDNWDNGRRSLERGNLGKMTFCNSKPLLPNPYKYIVQILDKRLNETA